MNFSLLLDEFMARAAWNLSPHFSALDLSSPRKMSGHMTLSKPVWANVVNWWRHGDEDIKDSDIDYMLSMFGE